MLRMCAGAFMCAAIAGCASLGPQALQQSRLQYNEAVKATTEEQLLLNIVRLRYTDTPSSLSVSSITAQFERSQNLQITPFFTSAGADQNRSFTAILPQAGVATADRPTVSLTPLDDQEFTRKLFTPMTLDGIVYLAKTTWPISTVFRLYLENLNWVPNAQTASGPTPKSAPVVDDFLRGIAALQSLQDRGSIVFGQEERAEAVGSPLPAASVTARDLIEAAKSGYEYRQDEKSGTWSLVKKTTVPVLHVNPELGYSPDMFVFLTAFRLKPAAKYEITQEALEPFPGASPREPSASLDLEMRSMLQALYYVSHGIDIPPAHAEQRLATITRDANGEPYDWQRVMEGLFRVHWAAGGERPRNAHVAVQYKGYWFYIDETDQGTKSTFSLLIEISRLELGGRTGPGPTLTIPLVGK